VFKPFQRKQNSLGGGHFKAGFRGIKKVVKDLTREAQATSFVKRGRCETRLRKDQKKGGVQRTYTLRLCGLPASQARWELSITFVHGFWCECIDTKKWTLDREGPEGSNSGGPEKLTLPTDGVQAMRRTLKTGGNQAKNLTINLLDCSKGRDK